MATLVRPRSRAVQALVGLDPAPGNSNAWRAHFEASALLATAIPWTDAPQLTAAERRAVAASVQEFQLGESSEGHHLRGLARDHAEHTGDPEYARAMELFIREEQRHAAELGRFLDQEGVPRRTATLTDGIFRRVRTLAGLETMLRTLLCAELVSQVYYVALREATRSPALRAICVRILRDEAAHVRFHCERLALLQRSRSALRRRGVLLLHRALFACTLAVVWLGHGRALRAGGFGAFRFWRSAWRRFGASVPAR